MASSGRFGRLEANPLAQKRLNLLHARVSSEVLAAFYQVTQGHPFYVYPAAMRLLEMVTLQTVYILTHDLI